MPRHAVGTRSWQVTHEIIYDNPIVPEYTNELDVEAASFVLGALSNPKTQVPDKLHLIGSSFDWFCQDKNGDTFDNRLQTNHTGDQEIVVARLPLFIGPRQNERGKIYLHEGFKREEMRSYAYRDGSMNEAAIILLNALVRHRTPQSRTLWRRSGSLRTIPANLPRVITAKPVTEQS